MKQFNSVALLAFSFEHGDKDYPTEEELQTGLTIRLVGLRAEGGGDALQQACAGDFFDTVENEYDDDSMPLEHWKDLLNKGIFPT